MKLILTLFAVTVLAALSGTVSANQTTTIANTTANSEHMCPYWPNCPRGTNEEEPPAEVD